MKKYGLNIIFLKIDFTENFNQFDISEFIFVISDLRLYIKQSNMLRALKFLKICYPIIIG